MTEDERIPFCRRHEWAPRTAWREDAETRDLSRLVEVCINCDLERTPPEKVGRP